MIDQSINGFTNRHAPTNPNPPPEQKKLETLNYELALIKAGKGAVAGVEGAKEQSGGGGDKEEEE